MKISAIQNTGKMNTALSFKAGVTEFFSDFDGTFMPHEYRHDVFCKNSADSPRHDFLKSGKKGFQDYFDSFDSLLSKIRGKDSDKLSFTITTGRNRPEYNYYMERIREDGLKVPLPDKLIITNGGDVYTKRQDIGDFFASKEKEVFLKSDFLQSKREQVKSATQGWDGKKIRGIINNFFEGKPYNYTVFEADTDGVFYADGMHFNSKRQMMPSPPLDYAALKDNGDLQFHVNFPYYNSEKTFLETTRKALAEKVSDGGVQIVFRSYAPKNLDGFGEIIIAPSINGGKIEKVFDTKIKVDEIIKKGLNDLVVVAGDGSNDARMLDLFEYIDLEDGADIISEKNLKKIYDLPIVSIFVDNSSGKESTKKIASSITQETIENLEKYFNSDGNVRFIRVIPNNNIGKPQSLSEALQIAVGEYAKRNAEFAKNLSPEMQELITTAKTGYPIDKKFTEGLEQTLGAKLWNPIQLKEKVEQITPNQVVQTIKKSPLKQYMPFIACGVMALAGVMILIKAEQMEKNLK